jgi:copper transport protein
VASAFGVGVLLGAPAATAHATLVSSSPAEDETLEAPPAEAVLRFDEPVVAAERGALTVLDPEGRHLERGPGRSRSGGRTLEVGLREGGTGTYTVSYRVLSTDGHVITGSFVFHVGSASGSGPVGVAGPSPLLEVLGVVGRSLGFGGSLLAAGALLLALLVDRRVVASGGVAVGEGVATADVVAMAAGSGGVGWPSRRIWGWAALLALVGAALSVVVLSAELAGGSLLDGFGELLASLELLGWSDVAVLRLLVALLFALLVALPRRWGWTLWASASVAVVLVCLPAFGGHASSTAALAEWVTALHLVAAAAWVGALVALVLTWRVDRTRLVRFGRLALVAAAVVIVSGVVSAVWLSGGSDTDLEIAVTTGWWRALAVKVAFVAAVLFFGWIHRRWIADVDQPVAPMRSSLRVEAVLAAAVVVASAVLVDLPPPRDAAIEPFQAVRQAGEVTVRLQVVPARSGANALHLYFLALDGEPTAVDATEVMVRSGEVAQRRVPVELLTPSHATGSVELTPGTWTVEVAVVQRATRSSAELEVPIR